MKTVTVRDLRQRWPMTERALEVEGEIVVTRDSKPVAKLVRYSATPKPRRRFDAEAHGRWQKKVNGDRTTSWVDSDLIAERNER